MSLSLALLLLLSAPAPPPRMLWFWYATEMKAALPPGVGIAFVIASLELDHSKDVTPFLRREAAVIPAGTYRMGVIRIEHRQAAFTVKQRSQAAQMISEAVRMTRLSAVQIDFDAPKSAWPFYQALIKDVRRRIGPGVFLSITALASWCVAASWLAGADVDEIVPMLFQMGSASGAIADRLRSGEVFPFEGCRHSVGFSLAEPSLKMSARRIYVFPGYQRWSEDAIAQAMKRFGP